MRAFDLETLLGEMKSEKWREFLRVVSLSMGIYHLKAGDVDGQSPHTEDEVYYVIGGRASFRAGDEERPVGPGTILFVERLVDHCFFDIREDLTVLVLFAPPEGTAGR
jgi:mannose-6-phosphate isomerase-like protein (cupin superfamily)